MRASDSQVLKIPLKGEDWHGSESATRVRELLQVMSVTNVAKHFGVSTRTIYTALNIEKAASPDSESGQ